MKTIGAVNACIHHAFAPLFSYLQTAIFYLGASEALSIDVVLPWHHPSLFSAVPILNNLILLLVFCLSHRYVCLGYVSDCYGVGMNSEMCRVFP